MKIPALLRITGLTAIALAFFSIGTRGYAADQQTPNSSPSQQAQAAPAAKVPAGCASGKMRCLTNDVRWKAAIQTANRRAAAMRNKNGGKGK